MLRLSLVRLVDRPRHAAAASGQTSGALTDKEFGYVTKGMCGEADGDGDKKLSVSELAAYVRSNVKEQAAVGGPGAGARAAR